MISFLGVTPISCHDVLRACADDYQAPLITIMASEIRVVKPQCLHERLPDSHRINYV
jgi:hypothetical protein